MTKSGFTEGLLPTLSNHHGTIQGLWGQCHTNKDVTGARLLPNTVLWIESPLSLTEDKTLLSVSLWKV